MSSMGHRKYSDRIYIFQSHDVAEIWELPDRIKLKFTSR